MTNTSDSGAGSLRQAIINADLVGGHLITFAIPGLGVETIAPTSPLPLILGPTAIDGQTQDVAEGVAPPFPLIQVDGRFAGADGVDGLSFGGASAGSLLVGVSAFGFSGAQVEVEAADVTLYGNFIGLQSDGTAPIPLGGGYPVESFANRGVEVVGPGAVIGGPLDGEGNVISGNVGWGVLIDGAPAFFTQVVGDRIGLDPAGDAARPNLLDGVAIVGGANHEFVGPGNTISGNVGNGVLVLGGSAILVDGDDVGTDATASRAVGNRDYGVDVDGGSSAVVVGGAGPFMADVVSGNGVVGVGVQGGSTAVTVQDDRVGTDASGESAVGNGIAGILIEDSPGNVVGPGDLVSGNGTASAGAGIWLDGPGSTADEVVGDVVGLDATGEVALANEIVGVLIDQASNDAVGGSAVGSGNLISGNASIGLFIAGPDASGNLAAGNLIGTNAGGTRAVGNGSKASGAGVYIDDASGNRIGGPGVTGNLISGNAYDGIQVFGPGSTGNLIQGNGIGLDLSGSQGLGNAQDGLIINGSPGTRVVANLIAANGLDGITVTGPGASGTTVQGNTIGQGLGGQALGNRAFGVLAINGASLPDLAGNTNVNNVEGPVRYDNAPATSVAAESVSATSTTPESVAVVPGQSTPKGPRAFVARPKARPGRPATKPR